MGYTTDADMVRVDFFKPSGKFYTTEAVRWLTYNVPRGLIHDSGKQIDESFHEALANHFGDKPRLVGMTAVCLEPYHENSHPQMIVVKDYTKEK